jgi:hypothetical protein
MKSYGRAPNFLMLTGYEQVRSIACALVGDAEGAHIVELTLPATGVCSTQPVSSESLQGATLETGASCCGGPAPAHIDACCALDAEAKAAGQDECGCGSTGAKTTDPGLAATGCVPPAAEVDTSLRARPVVHQIAPLGALSGGRSAGPCCG